MNEIEILYEDENILAVNKPTGIMVHNDGRTNERTIADWMLENYPESKDVGEKLGEDILRPGIVHRLDKDTSGVLLLAKTSKGHAHLKKQFQDRSIEKEYRTFTYGNIKEERGVIEKPIGKSRSDFRQWSSSDNARGEKREAKTVFEVLKRSSNKDLTYLAVFPKTGRTHQIRVHLKSIYHPIVSDGLYAPKREKLLGFKRLALHAFSIKFKNCECKEIKIEAALPEDFMTAEKSM